MAALILGLAVFMGLHALPGTTMRQRLVEKLGPGVYRFGFSVLAFVGLVLVGWGKGLAGFHPLWHPPVWARHLTPLLMLGSVYLVVTYLLGGKLKGLTAHPMLWGVLIWAVAHLLANGDWASVLLFGAFAIYSAWALWCDSNPVRPRQVSVFREMVVALVSLGGYGTLLMAHPVLFGVAVMGR